MFNKSKYIKVSYNEQGLIHFICVNSRRLGLELAVKDICKRITCDKADADALYEWLVEDGNVDAIARKHYTNEKKLYKLRKQFFEKFKENIVLFLYVK